MYLYALNVYDKSESKPTYCTRALARISELGVQKYTFGVNWVSNFFSSHCIKNTQKIWIRVSKISNRVSKRHPDTPLAKGLYCTMDPWYIAYPHVTEYQIATYSATLSVAVGVEGVN